MYFGIAGVDGCFFAGNHLVEILRRVGEDFR